MQYTVIFSAVIIENFYLKKIDIFMPPTLKKLEGHIAFGLSVCVCVRPLTFER